MDTGMVSIDGTLVQKTPSEIFSLYASLSDDPEELRKVLAPVDEYSTGECEVRETIVRIL